MLNEQLLKELTQRYALLQQTFSLRAPFERLDKAFFISDFILSNGYVSPFFSQQLCARITEVFLNWNSYLHGLVMPDPHHLIHMNESKVFGAEEKKQMLSLIGKAMVFISRNALFHARPHEPTEARFIDEALEFWETVYQPHLVLVIEKLRVRWST